LTGWSIDLDAPGLARFYPRRHDFSAKELLGRPLKAKGAAELDEALDLLARQPATARFVSRKLALFFVSDDPPPALVERMAHAFPAASGPSRSGRSAPPRAKRSRVPAPRRSGTFCFFPHRSSCTDEPPHLPRLAAAPLQRPLVRRAVGTRPLSARFPARRLR